MSDLWTDAELTACMQAYLQMLDLQNAGTDYSKSDFYRTLRGGVMSGRTAKAIGRRMCNYSAFFEQRGLPIVSGFKPQDHIGTVVIKRIENILEGLDSAEVEDDLQVIINPVKSTGFRRGQGFNKSAAERRAIELQAMELAGQYLEENGFSLTDTSANHPFDMLAEKNGESVKVEVKGTTNSDPDFVYMTKNEVTLHQAEAGDTALIIVHSIKLDRTGNLPIASGGVLEVYFGWDIADWDLEALSFKVSKR